MSPTFSDLGVPEEIIDALSRRGIDRPFEIQAATIADALAGKDVLGRAPTGSGKTLAFGIPLVANVSKGTKRRPRALVLAPTRELADQIQTELRSFSRSKRVGVVYGGVGYGFQRKSLNQGLEILVACPGRLEDLIEQGDVHLDQVTQVVLDEADRMADMGFMPAVRRILDQTAKKRQTVLFSATLDGDVAKLTRDYQHNPVKHEVGEATPDITLADHVFWKMDRSERIDNTAEAVNAVWPAIIFTRTRHGADRLAKQLSKRGLKTAAIHGGRSQNQRTRALADFAKHRVHALVATDVAARGIHVDGVASVIHYDPPEDHKAYVHRSGRTARAGESGVVVSLLMPDQVRDAQRLQKKVGLDEPVGTADPAALRALSNAEPRKINSTPEPRSTEDSDNGDRRNNGRGRPSQRSGRSERNNRNGGRSRNGSRSNRSNGSNGSNGSNRSNRSERDSEDRPNRNGGSKPGAKSGKKRPAKPVSRSGGGSGSGRNGSGRSGSNNSTRRGQSAKANRQGGSAKGNRSGSSNQSKSGSKAKSKSSGPNRKARRAHLQPR